jgi:hypothetical protein
MRQIAERREEAVRVALTTRCPCGAAVRTARWVVEVGEAPLVERLLCMCDAGHERYWKFEVKVKDGGTP